MLELFSKKRNIMFLFYLLLFVMVAQVVVLYTVLESQKIEIYNNEINAELERCAHEINSQFEAVKNMAMSISLAEEVVAAFYKDELTPLEVQALGNRLREYMKINRNITGIFVYNPQKQVVYTYGGSVVDIEAFQYPETQEFLRDKALLTKKYSVFRDWDNTVYHNTQIPVIRNSWSYRNYSEYLILIDISYQKIADELQACGVNTCGELYIHDRDGNLVCGSDERDILQNVSGLPQGEETLTKEIQGEKTFIKGKKIEQASLELYSAIPLENIKVSNLHTKTLVSINILLICALFILLGLVLLFRHIRNMMRHNAQLEENKNRRKRFLEEYHALVTCLQSADDDLLDEAKICIANKMEEPSYQDFSLLRFDIHGYQPELMAEKYVFMQRCEQILNEQFQALAIYEQDAFMVFLICDGGLHYVDLCRQLYQKCRTEATQILQADISAYISSSADISRLHELYTELCNLAEYKFIYNNPTFLDYTLFWKRKDEKEQWNEFKIDMICNNIVSPRQDANMLMEEFLYDLRSLSIETVKDALYTLFLEISKAIEKIKQEENLNLDLKFSNYLAALSELESLDGAHALFTKITEELKQQRSNVGANRHSLVVKQAMDIINQRACDPGLCRNMIADEIGISNSYLSRIFKDQVGISLSEMINETKMKIVEKELRTTNKSIKDIIEEVGIANQSYFTVVFKKKFGVSPMEYRNNKGK